VLMDKKIGIVQYIGPTNIVNGLLVGLELDSIIENGHDGRFGGKRYFDCKPGHGYFARINDDSSIIKTRAELEKEHEKEPETIPEDLEMEAPLQYQQQVRCGDRVTLSNNRTGVVRYVGTTDFATGDMFGIELDTKIPTGNDGSYGNTRYFSTEHGRGIFVRRASIIAIDSLPVTEETNENENDESVDSRMYRQGTVIEKPIDNAEENEERMNTIEEEEEDNEEVRIEVGSCVTLKSGQQAWYDSWE